MIKANAISLIVKGSSILILFIAIFLKGFNIWTNMDLIELVSCLLAAQALVLPIDISKIATTINTIKKK